MNRKETKQLQSNNTTGFRGVNKQRNKFQANITIDGERNYLGVYNTAKEAALAYDSEVTEHSSIPRNLHHRWEIHLENLI